MIVHKFGGSSVASVEKIKNIANIIQSKEEAVVVSASGKTTSHLKKAIEQAIANEDYTSTLNVVLEHHRELISNLVTDSQGLDDLILSDLRSIKHILSTISITNFCSDNLRFFILGYGEIWSANILTAYLNEVGKKAHFIDASKVLIVNDKKYPVVVDWHTSADNIKTEMTKNPADVYIITGFIAQNKLGKRTILGLNCSDYSAAIFAKLLQARELYIWTDVAGVYSANPQVVPEAEPLKQLTYKEALELAYFGASVVHPLTISPMASENTPVFIKSSYAPSEIGTKISADRDLSQGMIKGLTSVSDVSIVRVQGAGMIGVSGISAKVFNALDKADISVMMISQASSEYSICFAIEMSQSDNAVEVLQQEFDKEIKENLVEEIIVDKHFSLVTAVGEGMKAKTGSLSVLLNSLKLADINIHAIAQGSSERSVTFAVSQRAENRAIQAMHRHYKSIGDDVAIAVIGAGNIGKEFINQLKQTHNNWLDKGVNLVLVGVTNSKAMKISYENLLSKNTDELLIENTEPVDLTKLAEFMSHATATKKVVIDATANETVASQYLEFLAKGISVITPNKYANSGGYDYYQNIRKTAEHTKANFLYETNVCAGLPLVNTLQNMVLSGDRVETIKGIFSGTLSYLFTQLNDGVIFSQAVKMAYDAGYTEPDPRQDLSGMDVARKTTILAREIGLNLNLENLEIENLVPEELRDCSVADFFNELPKFDEQIMQTIADKKQNQAGVHYVGTIDNGVATVGIQAYDSSSPFANVKGTDNIVMINTARYTQPMVIQGAGAGVAVTAAGVFADLITIINEK